MRQPTLAFFSVTLLTLCAGPVPADDLVFVPLAPCRVIDTRLATEPSLAGPFDPSEIRSFVLHGPTRNYSAQGGNSVGCGIPDLAGKTPDLANEARAVVVNLVAVGASGPGHLVAWASNQAEPLASVVNFQALDPALTIANAVTLPICDESGPAPCSTGDLSFQASTSSIDLVVDVMGYFRRIPAGSIDASQVKGGPGSGLDADTVDGQHASAFMPAATDLWVEKAGDTMTGTLTLHPSLGVALSTTADIDLRGRVMRGDTLFIHANGYNTALGENALKSQGGSNNTALGASTLQSDSPGYNNTAVGAGALGVNTGYDNNATGARALEANTTGLYNTATGAVTLTDNSTGQNNTATGTGALRYSTTASGNTATGAFAMFASTQGSDNTATGYHALNQNSGTVIGTASGNTATGSYALEDNTSGGSNTATGTRALSANTGGTGNVAIGASALSSNTLGSYNIAVGASAGLNATTGYYNILVGNPGVAGEGNTIRIGQSGGYQTRFFAAGVSGVNVGAGGQQVFVSSEGQLGTVASSRLVKDDIQDLGELGDRLRHLRPVSFRYKEPAPSGERPLQYGLIAEEVAEVFPELVVYSESGEPRSVQYHLLTSILLGELQQQQRRLEEQSRQLQAQDSAIRDLRAQETTIRELAARLANLEGR